MTWPWTITKEKKQNEASPSPPSSPTISNSDPTKDPYKNFICNNLKQHVTILEKTVSLIAVSSKLWREEDLSKHYKHLSTQWLILHIKVDKEGALSLL